MNQANAREPERRRSSGLRWLIAGIALAGLVLGGYFGIRAAAARVQREVIAVLGPGSEIGSIRADWNDVEIGGLRIPGPAGWPAKDSLRADHVRIVPSWRSLLTRRIEIARIEVTGGYLSALLTHEGLRVLPTLIPEHEAAPSADVPVSGSPNPRTVAIHRVQIENGALDLFDATVAGKPWPIRLHEIDASLRDVDAPAFAEQMPLEIHAVLDGPQRDGHVSAEGWIDASTRGLALVGSMRGVDLLALRPYFVQETKAQLESGALDLDIDAKVQSSRLHAPGRLTLSELAFGGGNATTRVLGVPRDLLLAALRDNGGKLTLDFTLDGNVDDPHFSLNEALATRVAVQLAKQLGVSVDGLVEGIGTLGAEGIEGAGKAAGKLGDAVRRMLPGRK